MTAAAGRPGQLTCGPDDGASPVSEVPDLAFWVAIASLPGIGPRRLEAMTAAWRCGRDAWAEIVAGRAHHRREVGATLGRDPAFLAAALATEASGRSVGEGWRRHVDAGVGVTRRGGPGFPDALAADPEPPSLVFSQGDLGRLGGPRVAVVGTRRATRYGLDVAWELGRDLAAAGVQVVSGLALGIDGAAHRGVLAAPGGAPPVGVVGSGLDVVYPARHRELWAEVARTGVLLSEAPLGLRPERWRFPARNRLIAALAEVVVVVESPSQGGSLLTADEALDRGVAVMAVPGPVRSPASAGTNRLLADGAGVVRDAGDVLDELGIEARSPASPSGDGRAPPGPEGRRILAVLGWQPASFEQLVERSGMDLGAVSVELAALEEHGWVHRSDGWYEQRAGRRTPRPGGVVAEASGQSQARASAGPGPPTSVDPCPGAWTTSGRP